MSALTDYSSLLYGPIYADHGVVATMVFADSTVIDDPSFKVIDRSAGEVINEGGDLDRQVFKPVARVRVAQLAEFGKAPADTRNAEITFNGETWLVVSWLPVPNKYGQAGGEISLILEKSGETE